MTATPPDRLTHRAVFYNSPQQFADATAAFVDECYEDGPVIVTAADQHHAAIYDRLAEPQRSAVQLLSPSSTETHPHRRMAQLLELLTGANGNPPPRAVAGELPPDARCEDLAAYCRTDAALNRICPTPGVAVLCGYDQTALPDTAIQELHRTHPQLADGRRWQSNGLYIDPERYLATHHRQPLPPAPAHAATLTDPSDPADVRAFAADLLPSTGIPSESRDDCLIAINEIVVNAFEHATAPTVRLWTDRTQVTCDISDQGPGLPDPLAGYWYPEPMQTRGRGLWLAHQLVDSIETRTSPHGTTMRLQTRLPQTPTRLN